MKKLLPILILAILPIDALGHSGGTNSSGCHNNRKTGGYHCHTPKARSIPVNRYSHAKKTHRTIKTSKYKGIHRKSTKQEVINIFGTPSKITSSYYSTTYYWGEMQVRFSNYDNAIQDWSNIPVKYIDYTK